LAIVVDEYGDVIGLVHVPEHILEGDRRDF